MAMSLIVAKWNKFNRWKGVLRQAFFIAGALALAASSTLAFAFEAYVSEVYDGAFEEYLVRLFGRVRPRTWRFEGFLDRTIIIF